MANYNKVILIGHVTRDPELRSTQGGTQILKFGLAVNRKAKDRESTCYVDCVAFGKGADVLHQYVKKGDPLMVDGRLEYSTWEAKDGSKRSKLDVIVDNFQLMSRPQVDDTAGAYRSGKRAAQPVTQDEDIPF